MRPLVQLLPDCGDNYQHGLAFGAGVIRFNDKDQSSPQFNNDALPITFIGKASVVSKWQELFRGR